MTRRSLLAPLLLTLALAGCDKSAPGAGQTTADATKGASVPCALAGSTSFAAQCTVERMTAGNSLVLVMHHPDGGFRRLLVATDGRGVMTADGSEPATVAVVDPGTIEVGVGGDRYRLPATVKGQALPAK
jgi:hypothetical protein